MNPPQPPNQKTRYSRKRLITIMVLGASVVFILGFIIAITLKMPLVDQVAFIFCLGIVNLIGCTFLAAFLTRNDPPEDGSDDDDEHGPLRG